MAFLIVNIILLLNLIIAIMSDTYVIFKNKSQQLYLYSIAKLKISHSTDDDRFSSLIVGQVPFNMFILPLIPFLIIFKSK